MSGRSLTCLSCRLVFPTLAEQREHYASELHKHNLKRKIANMAPLTQEDFERQTEDLKVKHNSKGKAKSECPVCRKTFSSLKALAQHCRTPKHRQRAHTLGVAPNLGLDLPGFERETPPPSMPATEETVTLTTKESIRPAIAVPNTTCVCASDLIKGQQPLNTMATELRASLPRPEENEESEDESESESESEEEEDKQSGPVNLRQCLFCSHIGGSLHKNLKHMTRVHSFRIDDLEFLDDLEGLIEYLSHKINDGHMCLGCGKAFNDAAAARHHMIDVCHCYTTYTPEEFGDYYDFSSTYPDEEEEEEDEDESRTETGAHPVDINVCGELVLSDGRQLGHRDLVRYYRQRFKPQDTRKAVILNAMMQQYRRLGWITRENPYKEHAQNLRDERLHRIKLENKSNYVNRMTFRSQTGFST
eukprot:gnl/Trimastix_PCT/1473.p1 GENE.gnl/Trimastix_PCT/1473~~gnl/Trimastix_PCT/1473.p1  ORF type:complete len:431 (-),score=86.96 gnl/Trimastix_PCT/1473:142-1395(-)